MNFIGQQSVIKGFSDRIRDNTLSHAYALTGEAGLGKKTLANYLAKMILCTDKKDEELMKPCGRCRSCRSFDENVNPNFVAIRSETQKILIRQIRSLIDDIGKRPSDGRKVYLIEEADRMTPDAQNCLLKTLEEPPSYAVIFLTTSMYEALLITIRSRTVQIKLKPYSLKDMKKIAQARGIDFSAGEHIFKLSMGIPGKALQLLDDAGFEESRNIVMRFVFDTEGHADLEFNQYLSKKKESFFSCMDILESVYRDALLASCSETHGLINSDKKDKILEYIQRHDKSEIFEKIARVREIRNNLKRNMNYQLAVDILTLNV